MYANGQGVPQDPSKGGGDVVPQSWLPIGAFPFLRIPVLSRSPDRRSSQTASYVGICDRSRLWINAARFCASLVQLRPAWRRAGPRRLIPHPWSRSLLPHEAAIARPASKEEPPWPKTLRYSQAHHRQNR
jgi:hypothetical protein